VIINSLTLAHQGSGGIVAATVPDVCKTPSPGGPVPVPYPNISKTSSLSDGSSDVKADGSLICIKGCQLTPSHGDEAGTLGGVKSSVNMKEAKFILYSMDVKIEGKNACRLSDKLTCNSENTVSI